MLRFLSALAVSLCVLFAATVSRAEDVGQLSVGAGLFDLVKHHKQSAVVNAHYRFGWGLFGGDGIFRGFKPMLGVMGNSKGGVMGYGGFAVPLQFAGGKFEIEPSAAIGAYHRGKGIDLGGVRQFHLGVAMSYAISQHGRIGVELTHISNANTQRINPGANSALLTWSWTFHD